MSSFQQPARAKVWLKSYFELHHFEGQIYFKAKKDKMLVRLPTIFQSKKTQNISDTETAFEAKSLHSRNHYHAWIMVCLNPHNMTPYNYEQNKKKTDCFLEKIDLNNWNLLNEIM